MKRTILPLLILTFTISTIILAQRGGSSLLLSVQNDSTTSSLSQFLPDSTITPGDTLDVTAKDICVRGYSKKVRNVPQSVKNQAYANYHIASRKPGEYEVDHLISLELGGSNSIKNLWPQSYITKPWNAHVKDKLENELHKRVCNGSLDLKTAQQEISTDWIAAYNKYVATSGTSGTSAPK
jgi:hypothetical protein